VSYFVFQAISYLADVHLETLQPERHLGYFALSLAFFPKLLQGPIERSGDLIPQLKAPWRFSYDDARRGIVLFAVGLFKKVAIADRLGLYVDAAYGFPQDHSGGTLLLATYAYAFQIYFDFAGYTDMARGAARLFGIDLTQNFRSPYLATSVGDFWRRWHISFSRWILDYIFKPLQLRWRRLGNVGVAAALAVAFLACGLWHGATSGFLAWGALHALYMVGALGWRPVQKKMHAVHERIDPRLLLSWQRFATFHLVCLAWVFFRAPTVQAAAGILERIARPGPPLLSIGAFSGMQLASLAAAIVLNAAFGHLLRDGSGRASRPAWPLRWALYLLVGFGCFHLYVGGGNFIYFGF
jgi:D-alanyl-lipoteichoic acid acyltransferase DltB (MBOAT superfamily)